MAMSFARPGQVQRKGVKVGVGSRAGGEIVRRAEHAQLALPLYPFDLTLIFQRRAQWLPPKHLLALPFYSLNFNYGIVT